MRDYVYAGFGAQALTNLLLALVLVYFLVVYRRRYLAFWAASWFCLALYRIGSTVGSLIQDAPLTVRLPVTGTYVAMGLAHGVLLLLGVVEFSRDRRLSRRTITVSLVGVLLATLAIVIAGRFADVTTRVFLLIGVRPLVAAVALGLASWAVFRIKREHGVFSTRFFGFTLAAYSAHQLGYLCLNAGSMLFDWVVPGLRPYAGAADLFLKAAVGIAMVVWMFEEERQRRSQMFDELLASREQLHHSQKLEAVGRLAAGIAHDINNALTVLIGNFELLKMQGFGGTSGREEMQDVTQSLDQIAGLVKGLRSLSRKEAQHSEPLELAATVQGVADVLRRTVGDRIQVALEVPDEPCWIQGDRSKIEAAVLNLGVNAKDAMPDGGELHVSLQVDAATDRLVLEVRDTGRGMPDSVRTQAFEPFFTTKDDAGSGLGLYTVRQNVVEAGGEIELHSTPAEGTTVRILLPRIAEPADSAAVAVAADDYSIARGAVLVVEDNAEVRAYVGRILGEEGYDVLLAQSAEEALAVLDRQAIRFDIVVSDVLMPGMSGCALAAKLPPELPMLLISGYAPDSVAGERDETVPLLQKPFRPGDLTRRVRELVGTAGSREAS